MTWGIHRAETKAGSAKDMFAALKLQLKAWRGAISVLFFAYTSVTVLLSRRFVILDTASVSFTSIILTTLYGRQEECCVVLALFLHNDNDLIKSVKMYKTKRRGLSARANYTDGASAACRPKLVPALRIEGVAWSAQRIPTAVFSISRPEPLLCLPSSSSIVLTRLRGAHSRPTTCQKIW
jgi:hypothetical protein